MVEIVTVPLNLLLQLKVQNYLDYTEIASQLIKYLLILLIGT